MAVNREELGKLLREGLATSEISDTEETADKETTGDLPVEVEEETLTEEITEEVDLTTETEETEEQISEGEETIPAEIEDLMQLATAIEVEPEFLYKIKIPMSDGMESVSLSELKDGYTEYKRGTNEASQDLENRIATFKQQQQQQIEVIKQQSQMPKEIMAAHASVMAIAHQYQNYDWAELEKINPGEAALQKQNMASAYQQAQNQHQGLVQKHQQFLKTSADEFTQEQHAAIARHIPEWSDNTVRVKEQDQMRVMLKDYGYSDKDIDGIEDSRAMRIARDLWKLKELSSKARKTVEKIVKVPKIIKSGAKAVENVSKGKKQEEAINRAKKTRSDRGKAAHIGKLLRGEL